MWYTKIIVCVAIITSVTLPAVKLQAADRSADASPNASFAGASWIRNPSFAELPAGSAEPGPVVFPAQPGRTNSGGGGGTQLRNLHTYFRVEIDVPDTPRRAILTITGDDYYKFYFDGQFVIQGPALCYPHAHYYSKIDVTDLVSKGRHCLASHNYYHGFGPKCRAFNSGDNRSGFILVLDIELADGSNVRYTTDDSWKALTSNTFTARHMMGYQTQFSEDMDLRAEPSGWREVGFDDSVWRRPWVSRQDHVFIEQITPPLEHWRAQPKRIAKKVGGHYFFDFGGELLGHTRIRIRGHEGDVMTVWHGEELVGKDTVRHKMRCNCDYEDKVTLSGREDLVEFYDYRGFRYLEIRGAPSTPEVWVDVRHYPLDAAASHFASSDELLNRIWRVCKRGVQMSCQEVVIDNVREKGQHFGDTYAAALSQMLLTADPRLAEKAIRDFQRSQRFDEGILSVAPGNYRQSIAEFSLSWPAFVEYHYCMTGDRDFLAEMVDAGLSPLLNYFAELEGPNGLLTGVNKHKWVLIDWPANLRGGYDYENTKNGENTVVNAHYYHALRTAARLMRYLDRDSVPYEARARRVSSAINLRLFDETMGKYVDGYGSKHASLHAGAISLCFGVVPEERVSGVIDLIRQRRLDCGLYAALPVLKACYRYGDSELAFELLTSRDKHSWYEMLRHGATTPLEAWGPDQKWNTAFCQPVGTIPIYLIITQLMGLEPAKPGWETVRVAPNIPPDLQHAALRIPTPLGPVSAQFDLEHGYRVSLPPGMQCTSVENGGLSIHIKHRKCDGKEP